MCVLNEKNPIIVYKKKSFQIVLLLKITENNINKTSRECARYYYTTEFDTALRI
jgi:hypothetical protein